MMYVRVLILAILVAWLPVSYVRASHLVGGEVTYKYLGDSTSALGLFHRYEITLTIYQDCENGQPGAIADDNPAYLSIYTGLGAVVRLDTGFRGIEFTRPAIVVPPNFNNSCVTNTPRVCLIKKSFTRVYGLRPSTTGYIVSYQRCCRNNGIVNIVAPGDNGSTYFCTIPPIPYTNTSAEFKNYPPQIICLNNPLFYDHSATDANGDSLSYEFCGALKGASGTDVKPTPAAPPYDSVQYITPPYSFSKPITGFPPVQIHPTTGLITGTPNRIGRYLVTVCCHEWRRGVLINTLKREFQFVVTDCSKVVVADIPIYSTDPNTYIVDCKSLTVDFVNTSKGGFSYQWDFGVTYKDDDVSTEFQPVYTYPDTGTYLVKLVVNPGSTCPDSISRFVKVYPEFSSDFKYEGKQCIGSPIQFTDKSSATIKPITNWLWNFGDGGTSEEQNPIHAYPHGGTFNVILVSNNIKNCTDTTLREVVIANFSPYAGDDTVIVKGEQIHFNAVGGVKYLWSPETMLNSTDVHDPVGFYPDTGTYTYTVYVESAFGCTGYDTITVRVVNQASFFVPNAFSPNGDGLNDYFRAMAVGYRDLYYFDVYNRWGERVYHSTTLETGWDGNYKGKKADVGTYMWQMSFSDRFGKKSYLKGDVTLIR